MGTAKPVRIFFRRGDRRPGAVTLPVPGVAACGLPLCGGLPLAGFRCARDPAVDVAGGDRRLGGAGERGRQLDVRIRRG